MVHREGFIGQNETVNARRETGNARRAIASICRTTANGRRETDSLRRDIASGQNETANARRTIFIVRREGDGVQNGSATGVGKLTVCPCMRAWVFFCLFSMTVSSDQTVKESNWPEKTGNKSGFDRLGTRPGDCGPA